MRNLELTYFMEDSMRLIFATMIVVALSSNAFAGLVVVQPISVPTIGEWSMIAMFVLLGIIALIALRKRLAASSDR